MTLFRKAGKFDGVMGGERLRLNSFFAKAELWCAEAIQATLVTVVFLFSGYVGASSPAWTCLFALAGVLIDVLRWSFRYDWETKSFRANDWKGLHFYEVSQALLGDGKVFALEKIEKRFIWSVAFVYFILAVGVLIFSYLLSGRTVCPLPEALAVFDRVAINLVASPRLLPHQLSNLGLLCRASFVEFFYSVLFYVYIAQFVVYAIFISPLSTVVALARQSRLRGKSELVTPKKQPWGSVIGTLIAYVAVFTFIFNIFKIDILHTSRFPLNIHETYMPLIVHLLIALSSVYLQAMMFWSPKLVGVKLYLGKVKLH